MEGQKVFQNPIPVVVVLQKIYVRKDYDNYLLGVRRGIEPKKGEIAFPGGYQEMEHLHDAGYREFFEETGIDLRNVSRNIFRDEAKIRMSSNGKNILIFLKSKVSIHLDKIDMTFTSYETQELVLINEKTNNRMAFPSHQEMIQWGLS